jgi:hypothetical protein
MNSNCSSRGKDAAWKECMMKRLLGILFAVLWMAWNAGAQENVPVLSGAAAFVGTNNQGVPFFQPVLSPVLVAPIGDHWVIESRGLIQGVIFRENGKSGPYQGQFAASLDYLQVDYIANPHLTVTAGRFLTPFDMYNERFTALWIRNLQDPPIIYTIGTRTSASSNGGMLRGVVLSRPNFNLNYAAYFSVLQTTENLQAGRAVGGRVGFFVPHQGVELGVSYQRFLQGTNYNASGMYFSWQPPQVPLDVRAEYAHSPGGQGYWLEGAMHFAGSRGSSSWIGRLQGIARVQQFFAGTFQPQNLLPSVDTNRFDLGLNYYLPHDVRINGSYGRKYSSLGNGNIWNVQITYRFLFPAWPGEHK